MKSYIRVFGVMLDRRTALLLLLAIAAFALVLAIAFGMTQTGGEEASLLSTYSVL